MTKCKTCKIVEATSKTGQCKRCWRKDYLRINKDKVRATARKWYILNREKSNRLSKEWTQKNGYKPNYVETEEDKKLKAIRRETRRLYKLGTAKCEFCPSLATHHHHYTEPIQVHYFWYACTKCHNKIHHPEVNGELIIDKTFYGGLAK